MPFRGLLKGYPEGLLRIVQGLFWCGIGGDNGKEIVFAYVFRCKMMLFLGRMIVLGVEKQKDDN